MLEPYFRPQNWRCKVHFLLEAYACTVVHHSAMHGFESEFALHLMNESKIANCDRLRPAFVSSTDLAAQPHQDDYYDVRNQRFLGDENSWKKSSSGLRAIGRSRCLYCERRCPYCYHWSPRAYGATEKDLGQAGRQPYGLRAGLGSFAWNQSDDNVASSTAAMRRSSGSECLL